MSPHFKFVRLKYGFYRIYWTGGGEPAYVHEVYKWMPMNGYTIDEKNPRFESHRYYQQYEDRDEVVMKVKNFVEGYTDSKETLLKRYRMFRNDKEYYKTATQAYRATRVK